jgi:hypothetical protein
VRSRSRIECQPTVFVCNGDDWAFPGVISWATQLSALGISVDDFSHMNGGSWRPHLGHGKGTEIDANCGRYETRGAMTFQRLLDLLSSPPASKIEKMLVTFTPGFSRSKAARGVTAA